MTVGHVAYHDELLGEGIGRALDELAGIVCGLYPWTDHVQRLGDERLISRWMRRRLLHSNEVVIGPLNRGYLAHRVKKLRRIVACLSIREDEPPAEAASG